MDGDLRPGIAVRCTKTNCEDAVGGNQVRRVYTRDPDAPDPVDLVQGSVAFVDDRSSVGLINPLAGRRWRLEAEATMGSLCYVAVLADLRHYLYWNPFTLALRGLHVARYGPDSETERATPLFLGYETYVRGYGVGSMRLGECTPAAEYECPEFQRLVGSKIAVAKAELRLPVLGIPGMSLQGTSFLPLTVLAFLDAGVAWTRDEPPVWKLERDTVERVPVFSTGAAIRTALGQLLVLEWSWAVPFQRPQEDLDFGFTITMGY